ncbi:hypothetical protein HDK64DRAFT_258381 [Phyllosticta capitalensis]
MSHRTSLCGVQIVRLEVLELDDLERRTLRRTYMPVIMRIASAEEAALVEPLLNKLATDLCARLTADQPSGERYGILLELATEFEYSLEAARQARAVAANPQQKALRSMVTTHSTKEERPDIPKIELFAAQQAPFQVCDTMSDVRSYGQGVIMRTMKYK